MDKAMVQGYYTLEESAGILGMSPDQLKQLARKGEIRSFQDRGTWRFRIQDIQEMARRREGSAEQEVPLGDAVAPKPTDSPAPRSPGAQKKAGDVFGFSLDPAAADVGVNLAGDVDLGAGPGSGKKTGSGKHSPKPGSDSDVRLVSDSSDVHFKLPPDSDVKVQDAGSKSGRAAKTGMAGPKSPRPSKTKGDSSAPKSTDSGVRLVPMESDSDVRIVGDSSGDIQLPAEDQASKGKTDSDIRLEGHSSRRPASETEGMLTEEINLDEELKKDEMRRQQQMKQAKQRLTTKEPAKKSPFELSESDMELAPLEEEKPAGKSTDSSSDFELTPASESSSPIEPGSSADFKLDSDDDITLADEPKSHASGVNLNKPKDSGISLEQSGEASDSIEFELTLDGESTPKPGHSKPTTPKPVKKEEESDSSEFELSLDVDKGGKSDSDSEFELTLDDGGELASLDGDDSSSGADKDIFETDFEVPPLEEESGSEAVAVEDADTDLESSDFDLAIGDEDAVAVDESGSQVVALEEEGGVDDAAETVQAKKQAKKTGRAKPEAVSQAGEFAELEPDDSDIEAEIEEEAVVAEGPDSGKKVVRQTVAAEQAPWGIFPVLVLFPCVIVMVLLGFLGFELVQTQQGYKQGVLTRTLSGLIDGKK
jgi:hypothetical protein